MAGPPRALTSSYALMSIFCLIRSGIRRHRSWYHLELLKSFEELEAGESAVCTSRRAATVLFVPLSVHVVVPAEVAFPYASRTSALSSQSSSRSSSLSSLSSVHLVSVAGRREPQSRKSLTRSPRRSLTTRATTCVTGLIGDDRLGTARPRSGEGKRSTGRRRLARLAYLTPVSTHVVPMFDNLRDRPYFLPFHALFYPTR